MARICPSKNFKPRVRRAVFFCQFLPWELAVNKNQKLFVASCP
jgi:hypothetical protein